MTDRSTDFKPTPRWHRGLGEWVLTLEPQVKPHIYVRRADGVRHLAAVNLLYIEEPMRLWDCRKQGDNEPC